MSRVHNDLFPQRNVKYPTREEIHKATETFLARGGKITKLEYDKEPEERTVLFPFHDHIQAATRAGNLFFTRI